MGVMYVGRNQRVPRAEWPYGGRSAEYLPLAAGNGDRFTYANMCVARPLTAKSQWRADHAHDIRTLYTHSTYCNPTSWSPDNIYASRTIRPLVTIFFIRLDEFPDAHANFSIFFSTCFHCVLAFLHHYSVVSCRLF